MEEVDVVVVGGGPVGLSAAASLSYHGIKTMVVEKKTDVSKLAKAQLLTSRTTEHYRQIGIEKLIQEASWPRDRRPHIGICNQLLNGNTFLSYQLSSWGDIVDRKPGYKFMFFDKGVSVSPPLLCPQTSLEPALKHHCSTRDDISMLWGWEVVDLEQDDNGVTLSLASGEGEEKKVRAKYVIASDGGRSPLRKFLNVHTYGQFVLYRAVSMMVKSNELFAKCMPTNGHGFFIIKNGRMTAIFINLKVDGEYAAHVILQRTATNEVVNKVVNDPIACIQGLVGRSIQLEVSSVSPYNMNSLVTTEFQVGRCFFSGDSAHQWVPAGGLGLNTGIGDIFNLTWKLAYMIKGYGGPQLLKSYEVERKPVCDLTRRFAMNLARMAIGDNSPLTAFIFSSRIIAFFTRPLLKAFLGQMLSINMKYVFGFEYINSNVIAHEHNPNGKQFLSITSEKFIPSSLPGQRAPHVELPNADTILNLFGKDFVLLVVGGLKTDCPLLQHEMEKRKVPFSIHAYEKFSELVALYDRKYFLVRPDGIICWRSDVQPSSHEAQRIVSAVLGDCPPQRLSPFHPEKPSSSLPSFMFDLLVAGGVSGLLHTYGGIDVKAALGVGLGLFWFFRRRRTTQIDTVESTGRHKAALIKGFGQAEHVFEIQPRYVQKFGTNDVLIRVRAASVNPIDVKIRKGYIASLLGRMARSKGSPLFPILLGRDCSGEVVAVGDSVKNFFSGDQVYAALAGVTSNGTYAQLAVVPADCVALKPKTVDHREAASIPYVAATAYSALVENAGLSRDNTRGKKVLVHGGTGGVGSFAVQLLKAWGAEVTVTCSVENASLARNLGADTVIDYKTADFANKVHSFDVVFDTIGGSDYERRSLKVLKVFYGAKYVTIVTPKLTPLSKFLPIFGDVVFSWFYRFKIIANRLWGGRGFYYSMANPSGEVLAEVAEMMDRGEIKPVIDAVYGLDEIVAAHQHVEEGHTRGKVVVTVP